MGFLPLVEEPSGLPFESALSSSTEFSDRTDRTTTERR
jgi:hypothetical protein